MLAAALLGGCDDDAPSVADQRSDQLGEAADAAGLPTEVADFLADAAAGLDGTYRVVYEVADPDGGEPQRVVVTQRPPDRRLDIEQADGTAEATIHTDAGTQRCERADATAEWTCASLPGDDAVGLFDADAIRSLTESLRAAVDDYEFEVEPRTLLGVDARCLVTTRRPGVDDPALGESATLCLSPEGAQLLTEVPTGIVRATEYTTELADDAFASPAGS